MVKRTQYVHGLLLAPGMQIDRLFVKQNQPKIKTRIKTNA